tara:strand:+ start:1541 stop:2314 length:774 start_codon:yes stop_codon:yes gene_type:complete
MVREAMMGGAEEWRGQIRGDPAARKAGSFLIGIGSVLGVVLGLLLIAVDPSDLLEGPRASSNTADLDGMVIEALESETKGGEPLENASLMLTDLEGSLLAGPIFSNSAGRFSFDDVPRAEIRLEVEFEGYISEHRLLVPGDSSQIVISMVNGSGTTNVIDLRGESHLDDSALLGTLIALATIICGLAGVSASITAYQGKAYRRTQFFAFLALWSRGGVFIGPLLILIGMAIISATKLQFHSPIRRVATALEGSVKVE